MIQLQFLNKVLQDGNPSLILLNNIDSSYFSDFKEQFDFIKNHIDEYSCIPDKETFLARFPNFQLFEVTEPDSYLVDELFRDKSKQLLAKNFNKVRDLVMNGKTDEAVNLYINAANSIVKAKHIDSIDILQDTSRYDAYVERSQDFNKYYVSTGFKELDQIIGGWDREEELATIAARTNQGKTWILLKVAAEAAQQGLKVGIYSGEMSARKIGYRIDTLISHISNRSLTKGNTDVQNEYKRYIDSLPTRFTGQLKVLTPDDIGGPAGVTALRAFIEKEDLDMLCIDQHSLLEDDRHSKNPVDRAANISRDLKNLQVIKNIPIISVSQQNRSSTENGVGTEHIAQSDRIAQDSTIIIFFEQNKEEHTMTLNLVKSRDSENMKQLTYAIDLDKGIFQYIPEEHNALEGAGCAQLVDDYEEDTF